MIVFRIAACNYISDLSGRGASLHGGRWNSVGVRLLYTAGAASLAMLECLVHFGGRIVGDYCQLALEVPEHSILQIDEVRLPINWRESPPPDVLQAYGRQFVEEGDFLLLKVPSVLVPDEYNYLINPAHPDFKQVRVLIRSAIRFDERLLKYEQ